MGDEAAATPLAVDQSLVHQHIEHLADGVAADLVAGDQFGFGGDQIAGLPFTALNFPAQDLVELLVEGEFAFAIDRFEKHVV